MLHWIIIIIAVAVLFMWLKEEVKTEKNFTVDSTVARRVLHDFLKSPVNFEKTHPYIQRVSGIQTENDTAMFEIEEALPLFGKKTFPMTLSSFSDASNFASHIKIECDSVIAKATIKLDIIDNKSAEESSQSLSEPQPSVTIHGRTTVKAWRMFNILISGHTSNTWEKTVCATINLLGGEIIKGRQYENSS